MALVAEIFLMMALLVLGYLLYQKHQLLKYTLIDLRRAEDAALVAAKTKAEFLATVSHEIRTPLNGVLGIADLLNRRELPTEEKRLIGSLYKSGLSLLKIVNDILDFSKIESGKIELEYSTFRVQDLAKNTFDLFAEIASQKSLEFNVEVAKSTNELWCGDPIRLAQVLNNLIGNAIKFTQQGLVEIRFSSETKPRSLLIVEVIDQGPGIAPEHIKDIFEPFSQLHFRFADREDGTGLGLSLSKRIAEKMNGTLTVESQLNLGSTFIFSVPMSKSGELQNSGFLLSNQSHSDMTQKSPKMLVASFTSDHLELTDEALVLIVEDNPTNLLVTSELVKELKGQVLTATNGQQAIELYRKERGIRLILMDCQMPLVDGYLATRAIREIERLQDRRTPIVAVTAKVRPQDKEECLASGMDDFIAKPVSRAELSRVFGQWLRPEMRKLPSSGTPSEWTRDLRKKILLTYKEVLPDCLSKISGGLDDKNWKEIAFWAHRLRSSSSLLGFENLAQICEQLEYAIEDGLEPIQFPSMTQNLLNEGQQVLESLRLELDQKGIENFSS